MTEIEDRPTRVSRGRRREPREEGAPDNRERILNAASALMAERGYSGTTMSAICAAAGVRPPTVYWYFGSKEGLLAAVMEHAAEQWIAQMTQGSPEGAFFDLSTSEGQRAAAHWLVTVCRERPEFMRLLMLLALERREVEGAEVEAVRRVRARARDLLRAGTEPLVADIEDPTERAAWADRMARFMLATVDGLFLASQIDPDIDEEIDALQDMALVMLDATARRASGRT